MLTRIIPVLLLKDGMLVRSNNFARHRVVGDPFLQCARFNSWTIDEICYVDISDGPPISLRRSDIKSVAAYSKSTIQRLVSQECMVPLTWGGSISSLEDGRLAIENGADKLLITTTAYENPNVVSKLASIFGSQAVAMGIDYRIIDNHPVIFTRLGKRRLNITLEKAIVHAENLGAGEIFLHAIHKDGSGTGYDHETLAKAVNLTRIPIVALGGAKDAADLANAAKIGVSGVAAANLWHFSDNVDVQARSAFLSDGLKVRAL